MTKDKQNPFKKYEVLEGTKIPQPPKKKTTKTKLSDTELFQTSKPSTVGKNATVAKVATVAKLSTVAKNTTVAKPTKTKELKGNNLIVYSAIKGKVSNSAKTTTSLIGYQELAKQCNIVKRSVQNIINRLILQGFIERVEILNTKGNKGSKYKIATV